MALRTKQSMMNHRASSSKEPIVAPSAGMQTPTTTNHKSASVGRPVGIEKNTSRPSITGRI